MPLLFEQYYEAYYEEIEMPTITNSQPRSKRTALPYPGPWHEEPDKVEFTAYGFTCVIRRVTSGYLAGAVYVTNSHVWVREYGPPTSIEVDGARHSVYRGPGDNLPSSLSYATTFLPMSSMSAWWLRGWPESISEPGTPSLERYVTFQEMSKRVITLAQLALKAQKEYRERPMPVAPPPPQVVEGSPVVAVPPPQRPQTPSDWCDCQTCVTARGGVVRGQPTPT